MSDPRQAYIPARPARIAASTSGGTQFRIKEVGGDWLRCHTLNGTTEGSADIYVGKSWLLRRTPFDGETRNGITYTYSSNIKRSANNGVDDPETQVVVSSYVVGDVIYAVTNVWGFTDIQAPTEPVTTVKWLDLNVDGRAWAKEYA